MQIVQIRKTDYNKFCKLAEADILGIDDIGTEPAEVQDYGNLIYPIKELLAMRYDAQLFTVFTTNLEPKEIRQRYGDRIADRLNEMMTKVVYRNPTYRTESRWRTVKDRGSLSWGSRLFAKVHEHNRDF